MKDLLLMNEYTDRVMTESEWIEYCAESNTVFDKDNFIVVEWNPMTGEWEEEGRESCGNNREESGAETDLALPPSHGKIH